LISTGITILELIVKGDGKSSAKRDNRPAVCGAGLSRVHPAVAQRATSFDRLITRKATADWSVTTAPRKDESIRLKTPLCLEEAKRIVADFIEHHNSTRSHSSIGYIAPLDRLGQASQNDLCRSRQKA
jgi:hypothetical protein